MGKIDMSDKRWYIASILVSYRVKNGKQEIYPVYENFTLFYAKNRKKAWKKAIKYGKWYANIDDKLKIDGNPAYTKYEGIRKVIEIIDDEFDLKIPLDGLEISYSYMELSSEEAIQNLAKGRRVTVEYIDMDES